MNSDASGDLIGNFEPNPGNILCQSIGILLHHRIEFTAVGIIDLDCKLIGNAVLLQIHKGIPQIPLFLHLGGDLSGFVPADSLDLSQTFRLLLDDPEGILPELTDDPLRQCGPDALDGTGCQIALDPLYTLWCCRLKGLILKLVTVAWMIYVGTFQCQILTCRDPFADSGALYFPLLCNQGKNGVAIFLILKNDSVHIAGNFFHSQLLKKIGCLSAKQPISPMSNSSLCIRTKTPHTFLYRSPPPS